MAQNTKMLKKLVTKLISVKACHSLPKGRQPFIDISKGTIGDTEFMDTFEFKIGARCVFVKNLDLMDDLFNGAGGTIVGVECNEKDKVNCIIVKFDLETCGVNHRAKYYNRYPHLERKYGACNGTPIFREEHEYQLKTKRGGKKFAHAAQAKLVQFPLRLYYASTAHKLQVRP